MISKLEKKTKMAELTSTSDSKFKLGDLVWAKVKGFNYWPAKIVEKQIKYNRKIKNSRCVNFFGSNDFAIVSEDQIKPYEEFREQYSNIPKKSNLFRQALEKIEEENAMRKGTSGPSPVSSTTPDNNKTELFKAKKIIASSPAPLTRDYSRTPFKKDKRSFDTINESESKAKIQVKAENEDRKKIRLTPTSIKTASSNSIAERNEEKPTKHVEKTYEMKMMNKSSKSKPSSLKFGFIGLGKMGQHMARLLLETGHEMTIWNRTPSKCKDFEKLGANIVKTPGDVVRESDITFACLSNSAASQTIFFGNCGVVSEINATKGYVELTSLDYTVSMEIENAIKSKGGRYLEAPVLLCALPKDMEAGKLVAMVSGNRSLFDDCSSCFEAICSHVYFLNEGAGAASKMNVLVSTYYGNMIGSLMECIVLVERFGLLPKDFIEIISRSPLKSEWIENKTQSLIDSTIIRDIPIDHIRRDLGYCLNTANQKSYTTPITASANEVFKQKKHHYY